VLQIAPPLVARLAFANGWRTWLRFFRVTGKPESSEKRIKAASYPAEVIRIFAMRIVPQTMRQKEDYATSVRRIAQHL